MEDKIVRIEEEKGEAILNFKDGSKQVVPTNTIYTHYESGRKDCNVILGKPIDTSVVPIQPEGGK